MPRYLLVLIACGFLAEPTIGTIPFGTDPGIVGKWLVARARARVNGHPLPTIEEMIPRPEPKNVEIELQPINAPLINEVDSNNNLNNIQETSFNDDQRREINLPVMEGNFEDSFSDGQFMDEEDFEGSQRRNKPPEKNNREKNKHLKPGKHFPEGYPDRSDKSKDKTQVIFPVNPSDSARNIHRVLDSPLPNPGEGPTFTVFVRASENPAHGPTVHIVKHSVQTIMPIESQDEHVKINDVKKVDNLGTAVFSLRPQSPGEDPEDVLGAAKRDLIFRSGNLYGVPSNARFSHEPYDAFGHGHHGISINLADFDLPSYGHNGLGHGGFGHSGLGHGGLGHGGYGHSSLGGLSHGFGHGGFGHGFHDQGSFGHGHNSFVHSGYGGDSFGHNGLSIGIHGSPHNYGAGSFGQGYGGYGLRSSDNDEGNEPIVGTGMAKNMFLPYMGLLDMKGDRGYNQHSKDPQYTKPHCFPPYCPIHTQVDQPIYY